MNSIKEKERKALFTKLSIVEMVMIIWMIFAFFQISNTGKITVSIMILGSVLAIIVMVIQFLTIRK